MNNTTVVNVFFAVATSLIASYLWDKYHSKKQTALNTAGAVKNAGYYNDFHDFISASPYINTYGFTNESGILN